MNMKLIAAAVKVTVTAAAALAVAGAASAQSHSTTNMANPPQAQSDTKAGTAATPGKTATAQQNTNRQKDRNAGGKAGKATTSGSPTGERVDAGSSATALSGSGAGNGDRGAEGAMELKPSEKSTNDVEHHAFDSAPKSGKK